MASKAISEASAKSLLYNELRVDSLSKNPFSVWTGGSFENSVEWINAYSGFVIKPDVLIKRRGKLNLIVLNKTFDEVCNWATQLSKEVTKIDGVSGTIDRFILEPFVAHDRTEEYYACIYTERNANVILFCHQGGVDVGDVDKKAKRYKISIADIIKREQSSQPICSAEELRQSQLFDDVACEHRRCLLAKFFADLLRVFDQLHFTYLEINPLVFCSWYNYPTQTPGPLRLHILDVAAKVDQCAEFLFANNRRWCPFGRPIEFPMPFGRTQTAEETFIEQLDARTGASMKLSLLNPEGRIWTMSAGGGASVIYADTVCALAERAKQAGKGGLGALDLANYGEYSGAPTKEQTYEYAKTILSLMTRGEPHPMGKVLLIGGGIANFTNVAATFKGIVRALTQYKWELQTHRVEVFVRRAGPNYQEGLRIMRELAPQLGIPIHVFGPETHMTAIVGMALGMCQPEQPATPNAKAALSESRLHTGPALNSPELNGTAVSERELFSRHTRCIVWGLQTKAVQSMLDFDYMSNREQPSVACLVYPFGDTRQIKVYWGSSERILCVYSDLSSAVAHHPDANVLINFASLRAAYDVTMEAIAFGSHQTSKTHFRCVAIIAEGIPENLTRRLIQCANDRGVLLIGPATVGGIKAGSFKIGNTGGMMDNIRASKLYRPGSVAYVSRSGGLSNELNNIICHNADGVEEGIAIGGDRYPGSTFLDHLLRFESNPNVAMMVMLGEVGGIEEYAVVEAVKSGRIRKPLVAWCIGTCAQLLSTTAGKIQFGHAGACAQSDRETATAKNAALASVGAHVPMSFDELGTTIRAVFEKLVSSGKLIPKPDITPRPVPMDYAWAKELGLVRRPAGLTSSISDDRGPEISYYGVPISRIIEDQMGVGGVLGLLWFKRRLPPYVTKFFEMCLVVTADHGPAVSGAMNTIVTARAGKDLLSSLVAGLLTIGDRFGGALDGAARQFSAAFDAQLSPADFVATERQASRLIMGIGHRVKSITNPDKRVRLLADYVHQHFPAHPLVDYAFAVEKVTTAKRPNLILNVDGIIGVAMVDLLRHCGQFTREEADEYVAIGALNGLFVLGRSIGFIGHYLDQKRLHQGLYRHPWDDISYLVPETDDNPQ